jgi:hypothetical protein
MHYSEVASYPEESVQLANATQASATYCEQYFESTARGENNFKELWDKSMYIEEAIQRLDRGEAMPLDWNGTFRWFWAWWQDDAYRVSLFPHEKAHIERTLTDEEKHLIEIYDLTLEQLAWRRAKIAGDCSKQTEMSPLDYFRQEYPSSPEEAFIAKGKKAFKSRNYLDEMHARAKARYAAIERGEEKPHFAGNLGRIEGEDTFHFVPSTYLEGATFVQWHAPKPGRAYVMGVDTAEGLEHGDNSVIAIYDRNDGTHLDEVARYVGKASPEELGELAHFLGLLYNEAFICAERNKDGAALCVKLVNLGYPHLYHFKSVEQFSDRSSPESFTAGFLMSSQTKPILVAAGEISLRDKAISILSLSAVQEWRLFEVDNGTYKAPPGKHDDQVIADLLAIHGNREAPPAWLFRMGQEDETKEAPAYDARAEERETDEWWKARVQAIKQRARVRHERETALRERRDFDPERVFFS